MGKQSPSGWRNITKAVWLSWMLTYTPPASIEHASDQVKVAGLQTAQLSQLQYVASNY